MPVFGECSSEINCVRFSAHLALNISELPPACGIKYRKCEPTTHRGVQRVILPPPHHPHECRPEPTVSTPAGVGSSPHGPSGPLPGSGDRGQWSGRAARVSPPISEVSCVAIGTYARMQTLKERW